MSAFPKTTRRSFLARTGALTFAVLGGGGLKVFRNNAYAQEAASSDVNAWVTIRFAATEMGQGVSTALPLILAEELDADWQRVEVQQVDYGPPEVFGNPEFGGNLFTAGSYSVVGYFNIMRRAGAGARRILVHSAAAARTVSASEIVTQPGLIVHEPTGREMRFGEAATLLKLVTDVPEITDADLKPRNEWRLMGTDVPRRDIPGKTRGETQYSIDVRLPGMAHAVQLLAPVEGETPVSVLDEAARSVPGVVDVIVLEDSVNVVAESFAAALAARELLDVRWSETSPLRAANSDEELDSLIAAVEDPRREAVTWEQRGDATSALEAGRARTVSATYASEYVYHAQMEPLNAIASVDEDGKGAEVWIGTQSQTVTISAAADQSWSYPPSRLDYGRRFRTAHGVCPRGAARRALDFP